MANFSGSFGYMPMFAILGVIAALPATLLLWAGLAISLNSDDDVTQYPIIKRRLNRIALPICLLPSPFLVILAINERNFYGGSDLGILIDVIAIACLAALPVVGIYGSLAISANWLNKTGKLTQARWLLVALGLTLVMTLALAVLVILLMWL